MIINLRAMLPIGVTDVGVYVSQAVPHIGEHILLHLDTGAAALENGSELRPVKTRFTVVDVVHVAFNSSQVEAWMHPYNGKEASVIVTVESADEQAEIYLKRLAEAKETRCP